MPGLEHVIRLLTVIFVAAALLAPVVPWPVFAQSPTNDPISVRASVDNVRPYLGQAGNLRVQDLPELRAHPVIRRGGGMSRPASPDSGTTNR